MKTSLVALMLVVAGVCANANAAPKEKKTETVTYAVSLHCEDCVARVEKVIPFEKGVKDVVTDLDAKTVAVTFDPRKTDAETVRKAIEKLGYKAEKKEGV